MEADIRYLIDQGKQFFKNQAYRKAEAVFLKLIGSQHEFADICNMLGVIYHQTGQFGKAISYFQKALKINPNYTEALLNLSVLYNDLGEYKQAKALLAKSKKKVEKSGDRIDPFVKGKLANKHAEMGDLYRGVGLYDRAAHEFNTALNMAPHYADIRYRLALCLREEGKKQESLKEFQKIVKEKPDYVDAQVQIGITLYCLGKKKEARGLWAKLAKVNPRHQLVRLYLRLSEEPKSKKA